MPDQFGPPSGACESVLRSSGLGWCGAPRMPQKHASQCASTSVMRTNRMSVAKAYEMATESCHRLRMRVARTMRTSLSTRTMRTIRRFWLRLGSLPSTEALKITSKGMHVHRSGTNQVNR